MALPPASALLEPARCMPAWMRRYQRISKKIVESSAQTVSANVQAKPSALAAAASKVVRFPVSVDLYSLARNAQSEVGSNSIGELVALMQSTLNQAALRGKSPSHPVLYNQAPGHKNYGFYGPIHGPEGSGPGRYGRWTSSNRDPSILALVLARDVLSGRIPRGFNKGADNQANVRSFDDPTGAVRRYAKSGSYWVGPLPGVDHLRTFMIRKVKVNAATAATLVARGIKALEGGRPDWTNAPTCRPLPEDAPVESEAPPSSELVALLRLFKNAPDPEPRSPVKAIAIAATSFAGAIALTSYLLAPPRSMRL